MKQQYLGDSKDSFKWDYHDYLTDFLGYKTLQILLMLTPDDMSKEGRTSPDLFPAKEEIIQYCHQLRTHRDLSRIGDLPGRTGSGYRVHLHKGRDYFTKQNRNDYFKGISNFGDQVVLLDPDNGFEPKGSYSEKHVTYSEIETILHQLSINSVVSVFQHFRRVSFEEDFRRIRERLTNTIPLIHATAIYRHQLMFVLLSQSEKVIYQVRATNLHYAQQRNGKISCCF